jgi:DNA polymerase-3 subunit delta
MTYSELKQKLKNGQVPPLLLLYGEETFFVEEATRLVLDATVPADCRDFNLSRFQGRDFKAADIIEIAQTLPVFSSHRLILIKNIQDASAEQLEGLCDYLEHPLPETVLLVAGNKIDGRKKFYQRFRKQGDSLEFKRIYENQLPSIVKDLARSCNLVLTGPALKLFCKRVGANLVEVHGELEKLSNYVAPKDLIDESDVAAVVSDSRVESVFALTDALGEGRQDEVLRLLKRLIEDGQAPLMVLAMLVRHFRQLWKARFFSSQKVDQKDLPRLIGVSPYFLKGLMSQSRRYDDAAYRQIFELFLETDLALKSGGAEPEAHMERLVMKVGGLAKRVS